MPTGDVAYECTPLTGQAIVEAPPPIYEYAEYVKGKTKINIPEKTDSTITEHRLKGEVVMIAPEKSDTTQTSQKDSSQTLQKKMQYTYLGAPVIRIFKKNGEPSSKIKDTTNTNEKSQIKDGVGKENLFVAYPNPGKGEFTLKYELLKRADIRVDLLNENGSLLRTLVNIAGQYEGKYQIPVNVSDLPNGTYLIVKMSGDTKETKRLIIEK
jgi:hypothetical protein